MLYCHDFQINKKVKVGDLYTAVSYIRCTSRAVYIVGNLQVRLTYIIMERRVRLPKYILLVI
jgi:hypothetical protein